MGVVVPLAPFWESAVEPVHTLGQKLSGQDPEGGLGSSALPSFFILHMCRFPEVARASLVSKRNSNFGGGELVPGLATTAPKTWVLCMAEGAPSTIPMPEGSEPPALVASFSTNPKGPTHGMTVPNCS